ncbi:MAG TPA: TonB-dependent receptor [Candidatus Acidoferrales bacterium]|nr:TonB-dependent receptor [Candidatus Acidoferrales bacterium]
MLLRGIQTRVWRALARASVAAAMLAGMPAAPLRAQQGSGQAASAVVVTVTDENGAAVRGALVTLAPAQAGKPARGETDVAGRAEFPGLAPGTYLLSVAEVGFYPITNRSVDLATARRLDLTLPHQQEYRERVEVNYSPPAIDPQQTTSTETLAARDVINIPYSSNRDYRNALPLIPGVTPGAAGQIHVNGSSSSQIDKRLDGFDISDPVSGLLDLRVSPDALRSIDVVGARLPAQWGKGSGEALALETATGDDHFRFAATDFIPSIQSRKGIHLEAFTPRLTFSGPLRRGKAWFYDAAQGEYDLTIVTELPPSADEAPLWRWNNLAKAQGNLNSTNLLTGSFLVNGFRSPHDGLTSLSPLETTVDLVASAYVGNVKDQIYLPGGGLFEAGIGFSQFGSSSRPRGLQPFVVTPEATSGNFFETSDTTARRIEAIANLSLPGFGWHGRHQARFGADIDRLTDQQSFSRGEILIYRENKTLDRQATFTSPVAFDLHNVEASGYAEDGWAPAKRLFVELGLRLDGDEILGRPVVSPRVAASYMATSDGETKLSAGAGLVYAATNLNAFGLPLEGARSDLFFGPGGQTPLGPPVTTSFAANAAGLSEPRWVDWSAGLERMLPGQAHFEIEYIGKRGSNGFDYQNTGAGAAPGLPSGRFALANDRNDRYDAIRATIRYPFRRTQMIVVSYTRSRDHSSAVLDPTLDNPIFSRQLGGPTPWDTPNRLLSWGWVPLVRKFQLAYVVDWRSGVPFSAVDQNQRLVGLPDSYRFPDFFSLNLHLEKRVRLFGFEWAIRGGYDNITNRRNPTVVVNNVDSPQFLTFSFIQGRAFTGRIRFLGRK